MRPVIVAFAIALAVVSCKKSGPVTASSPEQAFAMQWDLAAKDDWRSWWALHTPGIKQMLQVEVESMNRDAFLDKYGVNYASLPEASAAGLGSAIFAQRKKEAAAGTIPTIVKTVQRDGTAAILAQDGARRCRVEVVDFGDDWKLNSPLLCN